MTWLACALQVLSGIEQGFAALVWLLVVHNRGSGRLAASGASLTKRLLVQLGTTQSPPAGCLVQLAIGSGIGGPIIPPLSAHF